MVIVRSRDHIVKSNGILAIEAVEVTSHRSASSPISFILQFTEGFFLIAFSVGYLIDISLSIPFLYL